MVPVFTARSSGTRRPGASRRSAPLLTLSLAGLLSATACGRATTAADPAGVAPSAGDMSTTPPNPDPRVGLKAGLHDAGEAVWNLRVLSKTPPPPRFAGVTNSDLAFTGNYAIQGNYNGWQIWDISNPSRPSLATAYVCPASQSDVSVYKNLLFISGEGLTGRLDCGTQGVPDTVSRDRLRGLRIFDISDIRNPKNVGNVQTCRGSHTHTVLVDPKDTANVYVYISGSAGVRSPNELPGCINEAPERNPNSALFRIEVIRVPVANPAAAAIVSSPRIFTGLTAPPRHGASPVDRPAIAQQVAAARARGAFVVEIEGEAMIAPPGWVRPRLDSIVRARGGTGAATSADSAALRAALPGIVARMMGEDGAGPTQCHDITVYPAIGRAGGACEGYGMLIDISDPVNPVRLSAVADSNFSYWHSATFNNDGTKIIFTDEWGGGTQPRCRATDLPSWGANAIFDIVDGKMQFKSYYKLPAAQTDVENCVAHNGSLIPVPGRDIMVQAWYQGGLSVFDFTDSANPKEIAYFDRGPIDANNLTTAGYWSTYWYNGHIYGAEIARGVDIFRLKPSADLSENELAAANAMRRDVFNAQHQPKISWPATPVVGRAYLDQLTPRIDLFHDASHRD